MEFEKESTSEDSQKDMDLDREDLSSKEAATDDSKPCSESEHSSGHSRKASRSENNVTVVNVSVDSSGGSERERQGSVGSEDSRRKDKFPSDESIRKTRYGNEENFKRNKLGNEESSRKDKQGNEECKKSDNLGNDDSSKRDRYGNENIVRDESQLSTVGSLHPATTIPTLPKPVSARSERSKMAQSLHSDHRTEQLSEQSCVSVITDDSVGVEIVEEVEEVIQETAKNLRTEEHQGHVTVIQVGGGGDCGAGESQTSSGVPQVLNNQRPEMKRLSVDKLPLRETRSLDDSRPKG